MPKSLAKTEEITLPRSIQETMEKWENQKENGAKKKSNEKEKTRARDREKKLNPRSQTDRLKLNKSEFLRDVFFGFLVCDHHKREFCQTNNKAYIHTQTLTTRQDVFIPIHAQRTKTQILHDDAYALENERPTLAEGAHGERASEREREEE